MKKPIQNIFLLLLTFFIMSCEKEVDINDEYKETCIVYGLINPNDSISYIRIEKAFLSDGDIFQAAQIADSNLYPYKLDVKMINGSQTISFDTITINHKEDGIFYAPKMLVYYAVTKDLLNTTDTTYLEIRNSKTKTLITSKALLHDGQSIHLAYPQTQISFEQQYKIEFRSIPNTRAYDLIIRFHYAEQYVNDIESRTYHHVDWVFPTIVTRDVLGGEKIKFHYITREFYSLITNNIGPTSDKQRYYGLVEVLVGSADDNLYTYLDVNNPGSSLVIDHRQFTNIENGYGIFAARSNGGGFYYMSPATILHIERLPGLNFVGGF